MEASPVRAPDLVPPMPARRSRGVRPPLPAVIARGDYDALLVAAVATIAAVFLMQIRGAFGVDSWLALAAGREVWQSGIPHHDTLTLLSGGGAWTDQQWLSQLATYTLYRVGGLGLVGLANVALIVSGIGGAMLAARRLGVRARTLVVLFPLFAWLVLPSGEVRTQAFAFPLFAATIYLLAADSRAPSRRVYWSLPLLVLWANLHGSASLGAGLVLLRGLTLGWERRDQLRRHGRAWRRPLILAGGGPLCLLLTPYGTSILAYYQATLFNSTLKHAVTEWQPITSAPLIAVPFFILAATAAWSFGRERAQNTLWERAALLMLAAGAIDAVRNVSFFSLASVVIVGLAIDPVVAARWGDGMRLRPRINRAFATAALLIVLLAVITTVARNARVFEGASLRSVQAVVARAAAADPSIRILSDQKLADWLLWADPRLRGRVAFDVRFELLSDATMRALQRLYLAAGRHWKDQARGYRLLVLDAHDDPLSTQEFLTEPGRRILYHRSSTFVVLRSAAAAG